MPYCGGLGSIATAFLSTGSFPLSILALIISLAIIIFVSASQSDQVNSPAALTCFSIFAIGPFFRRRYDFLNWGFHAVGQSVFQFQMLQNTVVVVSGESARQTFFNAKGLDLTEGFKILSGAIPMVRGVTADLQTKRIALIHKRLASVQRNEPLKDLIPLILEDSRRVMESWGSSGKFDPFEKIYELLFQVTIRSLSCSEIADDSVLVARLKLLYDTLDATTSPATVLVPWLPTPSMIKKLRATKEIYDIVVNAINARERSGVSHNDTLQMLLDYEDERLVVVGFIMGLLVAGARATGTTASWLLTFLGNHPEWREKAVTEVKSLLESNLCKPLESLSSQLATIPLEVWESSTPIMDAIIKETLRVAQPHVAMRRNIGPPIYIDGKFIPTGAYVVYPFSDAHLDPQLYPDPWAFNPSRQDCKGPFGYVGWGGGRTLCLGTRLAKVELKLITAMFVLGFMHQTVDAQDRPYRPKPNWNDTLLCRPPSEQTAYLKYERSDYPL